MKLAVCIPAVKQSRNASHAGVPAGKNYRRRGHNGFVLERFAATSEWLPGRTCRTLQRRLVVSEHAQRREHVRHPGGRGTGSGGFSRPRRGPVCLRLPCINSTAWGLGQELVDLGDEVIAQG